MGFTDWQRRAHGAKESKNSNVEVSMGVTTKTHYIAAQCKCLGHIGYQCEGLLLRHMTRRAGHGAL